MNFRRLICLMSLIAFMGLECAISWKKRWHYYGLQSISLQWNERVLASSKEIAHQKKLFGYNLAITHRIDKSLHTLNAHPHRVKFYVHGFGENKNQATVLADEYQVLAGDYVSFNLPDRISAAPPIANRMYKTSFGQMNEVLPTIYAINYTKKRLGLHAIDLFGYSRGGAVIANMLHVLCDSTGKYDSDLARIGIDVSARAELLSCIQAGSIVISCSIRSMQSLMKSHWLLSRIPASYRNAVLSLCTNYDPDGLEPLKSARSISQLRANVLIHYQHADETVGSELEAEFYEAFARLNPKNTYLLLGNDGGHRANPESLRNAIHTFYKSVGASYNVHRDTHYLNYIGKSGRRDVLLQPSSDSAASCINSLYDHYRKTTTM